MAITASLHYRIVPSLVAVATVAVSAAAVASPWTPEPGHGQAVLKLTTYQTATAFKRDGDTTDLGANFRRLDLNPYVEYGFTPRLAGFANLTVSVLQNRFGDNNDRSSGPGDQEFGLRYRLIDTGNNQSVITAQGLIKVPAYSSGVSPQPGNGQVDVEGRLLFGHTMPLERYNLWFVAAPGYRWRADTPANEYRADFTVGVKPRDDKWLVALESLWLRSVGSIGNSLTAGGNPAASENFSRWRIQLSGAYFVRPSIGVTAGVYQDIAGYNVAKGSGVFVGIWHRF